MVDLILKDGGISPLRTPPQKKNFFNVWASTPPGCFGRLGMGTKDTSAGRERPKSRKRGLPQQVWGRAVGPAPEDNAVGNPEREFA